MNIAKTSDRDLIARLLAAHADIVGANRIKAPPA
jgi:hypothetical protein